MQDRSEVQQALDHERKKSYLHIFSAANVAASALNLAGYLFMAGNEALIPLLTAVGKYIFFPFAAFSSVLYAAFAWYQYHLEKENHSLIKAIIETIGAVAIVAAVIGYVAFSAVFYLAGPIIFTVFLGLKTLFQAGSAIYYAWKIATTNDHVLKHEYREKVKHAVLSAVAGTLTTVAIIGVEIIAKPFLSIFGILAGSFAAACAVVRIIDHVIKLKAHEHINNVVANAERDHYVSSNAIMMDELDANPFKEKCEDSDDYEAVNDASMIPMQDLSESRMVPEIIKNGGELESEGEESEDEIVFRVPL